MCGIHGIINAAPKRGTSTIHSATRLTGARDFIQSGFVAGSLRGMDSSGMFQLDKKLNTYLHKLPIMGPIFIEDKVSRAFFADVADSPATVCHVRAATSGRISLNNCHPFAADRSDGTQILGVHNGTLSGWHAKAGKRAADYSVDSEWAFNHIASEGADAFEDFVGAYSLVWHDSANPTRIMFARNKERPMMFGRTKNKKSLLFASEAGMLAWLARRHEIELEEDIYFTDPDKMYCVDFDKEELEWEDLGFLPKQATSSTSTTVWPNRVPTTSTYVEGGYYSQTRQTMCERINDALRKARTAREEAAKALSKAVEGVEPGGQVEMNLLDKAIDAGLIIDCADSCAVQAAEEKLYDSAFGADDDELSEEDVIRGQFVYVADPEWYETHVAIVEEINHAKASNWFGELAMVTPAVYDEESSTALCDIFDPENGGVTFTGFLRGCTKERFDSIEGRNIHAVIVGSGKSDIGMTEFVLAELNEQGQDALDLMIN